MSATKPNGSWGTNRVQTSATGANYVSLPALDCDEVEIVNASGTAIDLRASGSADPGVRIPDAGRLTITVVGNANEIQIRRNDVAGTQVFVGFVFRKIKSA